MVLGRQRFTIISARKPSKKNINEELRWLGASLGLFNLRDKDQSCFRVFIEMIKNAKHEGLSSDELACRLNLSRGTVIHHINKLIAAGIVVSDRNKYLLRVDNLHQLIDEIEKDIQRTVSDLKTVASEIDLYLGLSE
ncbi:MAG: winged helix-turn-helix domain-containing protein [Nanoarchaeota archaeon]